MELITGLADTQEKSRFISDVVGACLKVKYLEDINSIIEEELIKYFPHQIACCCISNIINNKVLFRTKSIDTECFCELIVENFQKTELSSNTILLGNNKEVKIFNTLKELIVYKPELIDFVVENDVSNIMVYSLGDNLGRFVCRIGFINNPNGWDEEHVKLLDIIMPILYTAFRHIEITQISNKSISNINHNLSRREIEILQSILNDKTSPEVAESLGISTNTVRNHIQNIMKKLDVRTRTKAVAKALSYGIIDVQ